MGLIFIWSLSFLDVTRIGDNKKVSQIEMLPDEQLLVLISGKAHKQVRRWHSFFLTLYDKRIM